jgi:hypothetical protein
VAQDRDQIRLYGICDGQIGSGAGFSGGLRLPLTFIPQNAPHLLSSMTGAIGQTLAEVSSGMSLIPTQETKIKKKIKIKSKSKL